MLELPKNLKLDYTKWRCSYGHPVQCLGTGPTRLLNTDGYMCCIGQFSEQAGKPLSELRNCGAMPIGETVKQFTSPHNSANTSDLVHAAIEINDGIDLNPTQKAAALQELFLKHGHTIELVNFPEEVLKESQDV